MRFIIIILIKPKFESRWNEFYICFYSSISIPDTCLLLQFQPYNQDLFPFFKPETILSHVTQLMNMLMVLEEDMLVRLSRVTDPSRPSFRTLASQLKRSSRQRSLSVGSISSLSSIDSTASLNQVIKRGYYTVSRTYEVYLRVEKIFH